MIIFQETLILCEVYTKVLKRKPDSKNNTSNSFKGTLMQTWPISLSSRENNMSKIEIRAREICEKNV